MKLSFLNFNTTYKHSSLAIPYIISYLNKNLSLSFSYQFFDYPLEVETERVVTEILNFKPQFLLCSAYLWNIKKYVELIQILKSLAPWIKTIAGGPEVSYVPRRYEGVFDYIICGEGEEATKELLEVLAAGENPSTIEGIFFSGKKESVIPRKVEDLNSIPSPFLDGTYKIEGKKFIFWETSRGCPYNCSYCLSSLNNKVRYFLLDRVKDEIDFFILKNIPNIRVIDRTFDLNSKRALSIWEYILRKNKNNLLFQFEIKPELLTEDMLHLLKKFPPGTIQFEVGIQSTYEETLKASNRIYNLEKAKKNIEWLQKNTHVELHLDLLFGLLKEKKERFFLSFQEIASLQPDSIQVERVKVLPGTELSKSKEIIFNPHPPYQVLKTDILSFQDVKFLEAFGRLVQIYYNEKQFLSSLPQIVKFLFQNRWDHFFADLTRFWLEEGYSLKGVAFSKKVEYLEEFLEEKVAGDKDLFNLLQKFLQVDFYRLKSGGWHSWKTKERVLEEEKKRILGGDKFSLKTLFKISSHLKKIDFPFDFKDVYIYWNGKEGEILDLSSEERNILDFIWREKIISLEELQKKFQEFQVEDIVSKLLKKGIIRK